MHFARPMELQLKYSRAGSLSMDVEIVMSFSSMTPQGIADMLLLKSVESLTSAGWVMREISFGPKRGIDTLREGIDSMKFQVLPE